MAQRPSIHINERVRKLLQLIRKEGIVSVVQRDDLDQVDYRRGKPKGPLAQGRLLERFTTPGLDMLCGEVRSPAYEAIWGRSCESLYAQPLGWFESIYPEDR